jgi:hypothetical protein
MNLEAKEMPQATPNLRHKNYAKIYAHHLII